MGGVVRRDLTYLFVVPATLILGSFEGGGYAYCGKGWTLDCSPTWRDRLLLLAPLAVAWVTAVQVGEGGWWLSGRQDAAGELDRTPRPPVKSGIALGALLVVGLVATLLRSPSSEQPPV